MAEIDRTWPNSAAILIGSRTDGRADGVPPEDARWLEQVPDLDTERVRESDERFDREVAAALNLRDPLVATIERVGELRLREAALGAQLCNPTADTPDDPLGAVGHGFDGVSRLGR